MTQQDLGTPWDRPYKHQIFIGRKFYRNLGRDSEGIQTIITVKEKMVRRFRAYRSSVNYKRSIRRWLLVERTIKVVRANLIWRGRTSARKLRVPFTICTRVPSTGKLRFLYPSLFHSFLRSFQFELYMPQFRICVKQCVKLPAHTARRTVSKNNKPNKIQAHASVNFQTAIQVYRNHVNFSRNMQANLPVFPYI